MSESIFYKSRLDLAVVQSDMVIDSNDRVRVLRAMKAMELAAELDGALEESINMIMNGEDISYTGRRLFCDMLEQKLAKARGEV